MHSILIVGAALVGLPIILHLIMKQEPKRLPFPAFRFLRQKLKTNQRKLRLRHFILLALRMLLIALFCLALYQPTVYSDRVNLFRGEQPVAVVLVVDTSPSMGYAAGDKSRLDEARRRALELLDELPDRSRVAIVDTADPGGDWLPSVSDARRRLNELKEPKGGGQPVTSALATAYQLLKTVEQETETTEPMPKLVAVFTDRAAASWDPARVDDLKKLRDSVPDPRPTHAVVDVGVDQPANVAILSAEVRPQVVPASQPAVVTVAVGAVGPDVDAVVKCTLDGARTPERKPVAVPGGQTRAVAFEFKDLKPGLHQVEIALETPDGLAADNTRFLTFRTAEARKILTVADEPDDAALWKLAHDAKGDFDCDVLKPEEVRADTLARYEAVCLFGVRHPNRPDGDPLWGKLRRYVEAGGKLVVVPGDPERTAPDEYDPTKTEAANALMPGRFDKVLDTRETQPEPKDRKADRDRRAGVEWDLRDERVLQHPMLRDFKKWREAGNIDFVRTPRKAWKYWKVDPQPGAAPVVRYDDADNPADGTPAVLERPAGKGRVLMLTTRMDVLPKDEQWHDYWELEGNTWNVVFPWLVVRYLAGDSADANFNHPTGVTVTVPLTRLLAGKRENVTLNGPQVFVADAIIKPAERQTELRIGPPRTLTPGNYDLRGADPDWREGFSLNVPAEESQLEKVPAAGVEDLTGPNSVIPVGKDLKLWDVLTKSFNQPVDLFPWLLIAVLLLLAAEGVVANRFYRRPR